VAAAAAGGDQAETTEIPVKATARARARARRAVGAAATRKVGRNEPCPCGSGKKYKKCCGKAA
jgi:uncharacterized protein YecA (UPF0149 family)